ncbi:MAG: hypothetical protein AAB256_02930 [Deltaproteobacteria bacterium]
MKMSALVVGKGSIIGAVGDMLLGSGFDAVHFKNGSFISELNLKDYGPLDMLVLIKESVDAADLRDIFKQAVGLDIPVFLW